MLRYYCDGCQRKMSEKDVLQSQQASAEYHHTHPVLANMVGFVTEDLFCPLCVAFAPSYWTEKLDVAQRNLTEMRQRTENHRKRFFGKCLRDAFPSGKEAQVQ